MEAPASKLSLTLENLKTLWHLSQWPPQQGLGTENIETDLAVAPQ